MQKIGILINFAFALFFLTSQCIYAQQIQENNYGINGGIIIAIGTKIDRIGISVNGYYKKNHFQLNPELRLYFNFKNLGPKKQSVEAHTSLGIVYAYGKQQIYDTNLFLSSVSNQTHYKNSVGYSFNFYYNDIKTTQQTGIVSFQFDKFSFITENDLFARSKIDRFRTGAFLVQYRNKYFQYGINSTLFTGEMGNKIKDVNYPYSHLYKDTVGGKYTQYSHGLLSAQIQYILPNYQQGQASIGVDSERVRHFIQNRLIHDVFNSKKHTHAHIPMIDIEGNQFLFKEKQKIKPTELYINIFTNASLFY